LNLAGNVDVEAERKRLEKDLAAARKEAQSMTAKLGNEAFTAKAPADVIEKSAPAWARGRGGTSTRLESRLAALRLIGVTEFAGNTSNRGAVARGRA